MSNRLRNRSHCGWLVLLVGLLAACSGGYAPVTEQSLGARNSTPPPSQYTVQKGDTLYAIAWRYGLDYRAVARQNGIDSRYIIYPGQKLRLGASASEPTAAPAAAAAGTVAAATSTGSGTNSKTTTPTALSRPKATPSAASEASSGPISWNWPVQGALLARFSSGETPNKGIDLAGNVGDPVHSAAPGRVVYAGSGLLGYGNLVIVNHNQQYLSAYAHNSRIFVKEGDTVKAGEKIAEIGNTGASRPMLHFEIRRDGKPVDPLKYLPKK